MVLVILVMFMDAQGAGTTLAAASPGVSDR